MDEETKKNFKIGLISSFLAGLFLYFILKSKKGAI